MSPGPGSGSRRGAFHWLTRALAIAGSLWIMLVMVLVCADVAGRYLLNRPIPGVAEVVALSIVGIVYLQLAHTLRLERFIRSDVFILPLMARRPRAGYALQCAHHVAGAALCLMILGFAAPGLVEAFRDGDYVGTPGVFTAPKWPIQFVVCLAMALTALQFLRHAWRDVMVAAGRLAPPAVSQVPTHE